MTIIEVARRAARLIERVGDDPLALCELVGETLVVLEVVPLDGGGARVRDIAGTLIGDDVEGSSRRSTVEALDECLGLGGCLVRGSSMGARNPRPQPSPPTRDVVLSRLATLIEALYAEGLPRATSPFEVGGDRYTLMVERPPLAHAVISLVHSTDSAFPTPYTRCLSVDAPNVFIPMDAARLLLDGLDRPRV